MAASVGALSPVEGTWLPLWAPCPREGNVAASVGALSPWRERGCLCGRPVPHEGNVAATAGVDDLTSQLAASTHINICGKELIIEYQ